MKHIDKSSPVLFLNCASGKTIRSGFLTGVASRSGQAFLKWTLTDILIDSVSSAGEGGAGGRPSESVSLNFLKIDYAYYPPTARGVSPTPITATWDLSAGNLQ
jgi:type VI secretion system secreted protein Hcp